MALRNDVHLLSGREPCPSPASSGGPLNLGFTLSAGGCFVSVKDTFDTQTIPPAMADY